MAEKEKVRAVEDIQAAIRDAAERLAETVRGLGLRELLGELEAHHPRDLAPMAADDVCPSVAWLAHGDLENAVETLGEALAVLRRAASRTAESVRRDWIRDRVKRTLLESILEAHGPSGAGSAAGGGAGEDALESASLTEGQLISK